MDLSIFTSEQWIDLGISMLIFFLVLILGRPILSFLIKNILGRITSRTQSKADDIIISAVHMPLYWLLVVIALQFGINRLDFLEPLIPFDLQDVFFVLYFLIVLVVVWRLVAKLTAWYSKEVAPRTGSALDNQLLPFFRRVALIVIAVLAAIILLDYFDIEVSGLVATLGIGTLAIALAAQAALSDTISGFMIMLDRPFRIGDRIEIQDLDTWGDVIDIGLRSTQIRTRDNRMVVVPNSVISKSLIVNYSYPDSQYRIQIELGLAYGTDIDLARNTIIDAVQKVEGVLPDKAVEALFLQFAESAMIFRVRWWLDSYEDTRRMFDKVNTAMYYALKEKGIELPNPQQDVHLKIDPSDLPKFQQVLSPGKEQMNKKPG